MDNAIAERTGLYCEEPTCDKKIESGRLCIIGGKALVLCYFCVQTRFHPENAAEPNTKEQKLKLSKVVVPAFEGKPSKVMIADREIPVASWCGVLESVLTELAKTKEPEFKKVVEGYPQFVGLDKTKFSRPKQLSGGAYYFEGRMTTKKLLALFQAIRTTAGFTPDNMRIVS